MGTIDQLFDTLDAWRHLPNYQLERRADIFFSLYLRQAIEAKYRTPFSEIIIPEFPVRVGTVFESSESNKSYKIDYVLLSEDGKNAVFVELKTDKRSRRDEQDEYLRRACAAGMPALIDGIIEIYAATSSKEKYRHLLNLLQRSGQITHSETDVKGDAAGSSESGTFRATSTVTKCWVVYVQPDDEGKEGDEIISFREFSKVVKQFPSEVSSRFAESLEKWERSAGHAEP